jgi:hypothetical protein
MKKILIIFAMLIGLLLVVIFTNDKYQSKLSPQLTYDYNKSMLNNFYIDENGYVILKYNITVTNHSNKKLMFVMRTDLSKEIGLITEKLLIGYSDDTNFYGKFAIDPKSTQTYPVIFRSLNGDKKTKSDRLPPKDIIFTIQ